LELKQAELAHLLAAKLHAASEVARARVDMREKRSADEIVGVD
jgi:hypothetical protein